MIKVQAPRQKTQEEEQRTYAEIVIGIQDENHKGTEPPRRFRTQNQQWEHLKKKKDSKEQHHSEYPLHPGVKIFFLVDSILVKIVVRKLQIVEPIQRT